jgi:hypothetical protein
VFSTSAFLKGVWLLLFACSKAVVQAKHVAVLTAIKYVTLMAVRMKYFVQPISCSHAFGDY